MSEVLTNSLIVQLSNGGLPVSSGATSITVAYSSGGTGVIPSVTTGQTMRFYWDGELIEVTANSGTGNVNWTIVRGIESSVATSHADASVLYQIVTAGGLNQYICDRIQQESSVYAADTGTANAYAVALTPAPTLVAGSIVSFLAAHSNTGASTLAVNGGSTIAITRGGTNALIGGEIVANQIVDVTYDGTYFQLPGLAGILTPAPPYLVDSQGNHYVSPSMYKATLPSATPTVIASSMAVTAGANGSILAVSSGTSWASLTATTSSEVVFQAVTVGNSGWCGPFLWDSTNNFMYVIYPSNNGSNTITWYFQKWSYNGSGSPTFSTTLSSTAGVGLQGWSGPAQVKLSMSGSTMTASISLDGGATYVTITTASSVGTITKGGYACSTAASVVIYSLKVT